MSDYKLVSPLLDGFIIGDPMSSHDGVSCCPAMKENSDEKYIVKKISVPASQTQLDALLLTGAYKDAAAAMEYFKELADGVVREAELLQKLAKLEGFLPYQDWQIAPMDEGRLGYDVYLIGSYKRSLEKFLRRNSMTHLGAVNLGLDMCAALAICRRAGYLYVDLKPANIYLTGEREYRIGDLGLISLKELKYTSLPRKYLSPYIPPELHDALATVNPTVDVYSIGMVLYQIYNNSTLPFENCAPAEELAAPLNADYEMAEIIMKAISPDPRTRWQNPIEMGQALVGYLQRNIINDNPIVPPAVQPDFVVKDIEPAASPEIWEESAAAAESEVAPEDTPISDIADQSGIPEEKPDAAADSDQTSADSEPEQESTPSGEAEAPSEDTLQLLDHMTADETAPSAENGDDRSDAVMTDEVNSILAEADELLSMDVPDPVVVPRPHPAPEKPQKVPDPPKPQSTHVPEESDDKEEDESVFDYIDLDQARKKKRVWIRAVTFLLVLVLVAGSGYYFYENYYLMPIDKMFIDGRQDSMTVELTTDIDESMLRVVCTDTYGNTKSVPVSGGKAVFESLSPATTYMINVEIEGFHALSGAHTGSYTTAEQTQILNFTAVTGAEDGSVVLNFTVDGPETQDWMVVYSTEGEQEQSISFTGHMVTVSGLTVGKNYTFRLVAPPASDLYLAGTDTLQFTASRIVIAEELRIVSVRDGALTAQWNAPNDFPVESWTVRCYSESGYDETITVTGASASFSGISIDHAYTVEVTAAGMAQSARTYVTANPTTVSNMKAEINGDGDLVVTWEATDRTPEDGWLLMYSIDDGDNQEVITCPEPSATLPKPVPNATYNFFIKVSDGSTVFGGELDFTTARPTDFEDHSLTAAQIQVSLCKTPDLEKWTYKDLNASSDYTTKFAAGQKASVVLYATDDFRASRDKTDILFVIRNEDGMVLSNLTKSQSSSWNSLWKDQYAYLDIPVMPAEPGSYVLEIYFDNALVTEKGFTILQ